MNTRATSTGFVVIRDISTGFVDGAGTSQIFFCCGMSGLLQLVLLILGTSQLVLLTDISKGFTDGVA